MYNMIKKTKNRHELELISSLTMHYASNEKEDCIMKDKSFRG